MKKISWVILITVIMLLMFQVAAFADDGIAVLIDGKSVEFDVPPQLINGRTMVPMRKIFEEMGASVEWDGDTKTVMATKGDITVIMQIDNLEIAVNDKKIVLDVPPLLVDSRTLVPARAVAESFNAKVEWDEENQTVIITTAESEELDIYKYPNPVIDFSGDDGTMSTLHREIRLIFEQEQFPEKLFENRDILKESIQKNPEEFLKFVDNEVWSPAVDAVLLVYMMYSVLFNALADKYKLHAYQNYEVDAIKLTEEQYCIIFNMADIYDSLLLEDSYKMFISTYLAVVYDTAKDTMHYYLLEKSLDDNYALCSIDRNLSHATFKIINNDKKEFVEAIKVIENSGSHIPYTAASGNFVFDN